MPYIDMDDCGDMLIRDSYICKEVIGKMGGVWDAKEKAWRLVLTPANVENLITQVPDIEVCPGFDNRVEECIEREKKLDALWKMAKIDKPVRLKIAGLNAQLYNYQRIGVMYTVANGYGVLLADEMGLGKTIQALSYCLYLKNKGLASQVLIVTPASLKYNWPVEIEKFTKEKYCVIDSTSPDERVAQWLRDDVFFFIVNYELVLEDLFGGREYKIAKNDSPEKKAKKIEQIKKAKMRQRILAPVRQRMWDAIVVDECFHPESRVKCYDKTRTISEIVVNRLSVLVESFNISTNQIELKPVIGWYKNSVKQCYRLITDGGTGYPSGNHTYLTPQGKRTVDSLSVGDEILFWDCGFSDLQLGAIAGTLLGDGSISGNGTFSNNCNRGSLKKSFCRRYRVKWTHGVCQRDYLQWKAKLFGVESLSDSVGGYSQTRLVRACTKSLIYESFYRKICPDGKKQVTREWLDCVNELGLALWYMDDGSVNNRQAASKWAENVRIVDLVTEFDISNLSRRKIASKYGISEHFAKVAKNKHKEGSLYGKWIRLSQNKQYCKIHTEGFAKHEVDLIVSWMRGRWGIECAALPVDNYYYLSFSAVETVKLFKIIAKYIPACMRYKLGDFHGEPYCFSPDEDDLSIKPRLRVGAVLLKDKYKKPCTTYNIEVEGNHNYFVGNTLVANCHALKNPSSKRSKNIKALRGRVRVGLTGTPLDGRLEELHSVMGFVAPGLLGSRSKFFDRYVETDFFGTVTGYKNISSLRKIIKPFYLRRLKKDVLADLPDKVYQIRVVSFSAIERKIYNELVEGAHDVTEEAEAMVVIIRCRQFCNWPAFIDPTCRMASKKDMFKETMQEIVDNGHKSLVFSQYKETLDVLVPELEAMGMKYLRIDGDTLKKDRADMQAVFNNDKSIDLMIGTEAMSTGLNFTAADYVVNYDDSWSPSIMDQRADRCHRVGQRNVVTVVNFVCKNTIEERVRVVIREKMAVTKDALGDVDEMKALGLRPTDLVKLL